MAAPAEARDLHQPPPPPTAPQRQETRLRVKGRGLPHRAPPATSRDTSPAPATTALHARCACARARVSYARPAATAATAALCHVLVGRGGGTALKTLPLPPLPLPPPTTPSFRCARRGRRRCTTPPPLFARVAAIPATAAAHATLRSCASRGCAVRFPPHPTPPATFTSPTTTARLGSLSPPRRRLLCVRVRKLVGALGGLFWGPHPHRMPCGRAWGRVPTAAAAAAVSFFPPVTRFFSAATAASCQCERHPTRQGSVLSLPPPLLTPPALTNCSPPPSRLGKGSIIASPHSPIPLPPPLSPAVAAAPTSTPPL